MVAIGNNGQVFKGRWRGSDVAIKTWYFQDGDVQSMATSGASSVHPKLVAAQKLKSKGQGEASSELRTQYRTEVRHPSVIHGREKKSAGETLLRSVTYWHAFVFTFCFPACSRCNTDDYSDGGQTVLRNE